MEENNKSHDIYIKCVGTPIEPCSDEFAWTAGEQEYFKKNNLHPPKRCANCRKKMKTLLGKE